MGEREFLVMSGFVKDTLLTLGARLGITALGLVSGVVVARFLGPALHGAYSLSVLWLAMFAMIWSMGLGPANVYLGASQPERRRALAGNALLSSVALGGLAIASVYGVCRIPAVAAYLASNEIPVHWLLLIALTLPLTLLQHQFRDLLRSAGDIKAYNFIMLLTPSVMLLVVTVGVVLYGLRLGGVFLAWAIAEGVSSLVAVGLGLRKVGWRAFPDGPLFRESIQYGLRLHPGNLALFLNYRLDFFLVAFFRSPVEVGWYVVATGLAEKLYELPVSIWTVLLHRISSRRPEEAIAGSASVFRIMLVLLVLVCLVFAALAYPFIRFLYGAAFVPAVAACWVLLPGIWLFGSCKVLGVHLMATGRPGQDAASAIVSLVVTVVLDLLLIPRFGILGAAFASSVAYSTAGIWLANAFVRETGLSWRELLSTRKADWVGLQQAVSSALAGIGVRK